MRAWGLRPPSGQVIEGVSVQPLQGPPGRRLRRPRAGHTQPGQGLLIGVSSPFGDRGKRARPGQHRAHRQAQDHCQPVAHTPAVTRVSDPGRHRQQAWTVLPPIARQGQPGSRRQDLSAMMTARAWSLGKRSGWCENSHDHPKGRARTPIRSSTACHDLPPPSEMTSPSPWGAGGPAAAALFNRSYRILPFALLRGMHAIRPV